jgi:succinate-semialdehyde dehydrogenase/glutarate-semialdehyde dehydrogenase
VKSINPTTGEVTESYQDHSWVEIDEKIRQSRSAFQMWRRFPYEERAARINALAKILKKERTELARLMAAEMGKPVKQGEGEIDKCVWLCDFFAREGGNYLSDLIVPTDARKSFVHFEPLGVVLAVMPWNFPFWQVIRCAVPILFAGNTMILKHASNVSGSSLMIESMIQQAGFPAGSFNSVVTGSETVGKIIEHEFIQAVTVTGSVGAGRAIAAKAGEMIKKTVLELGGSDAYVVLEDADLEFAAETCAASRMINGGQSCVSAKRFIVVESVFERFEKLFVAKMDGQRMGSPLEEGTTLGPLARHDLRDQLHEQVRASVKLGAKVLLGGQIPPGPGAFYPATVLSGVTPGMPAYHEEFFGPVASLICAKDEKDAVRIANDTSFGLGAAVFTRDIKRGERIAAEELEAGCCFVNDFVKSDPRLPFGGIRHSGYGRELSMFGIREFVNVKTVYIK